MTPFAVARSNAESRRAWYHALIDVHHAHVALLNAEDSAHRLNPSMGRQERALVLKDNDEKRATHLRRIASLERLRDDEHDQIAAIERAEERAEVANG